MAQRLLQTAFVINNYHSAIIIKQGVGGVVVMVVVRIRELIVRKSVPFFSTEASSPQEGDPDYNGTIAFRMIGGLPGSGLGCQASVLEVKLIEPEALFSQKLCPPTHTHFYRERICVLRAQLYRIWSIIDNEDH